MTSTTRINWLGCPRLFVSLILFLLPVVAFGGYYGMEEIRPIMIKADTDRDGFLSRAEVLAENCELLTGFEKADLNRDDRLDPGEFELLLISL